VLDLDERRDETVLVARAYAALPGFVGGFHRRWLLLLCLLRDVRRRAEHDVETT
jgi:hypothetical protein